MISDKTHKLFEEIAEYIIKLYKRAEKAEAMVELDGVERLAKEIKEQNTTIDVLIKKYSNVQFVNKKLQEKIKRQAERITQLEALYREEIKTKKQEALRERAEKAESECKTLSDILAKDTMDALGATRRAKKAEAMVERMINEVAKMEKGFELYIKTIGNGAVGIENFTEDWNALVAEWKEMK